jgi:hypothetical protein
MNYTDDTYTIALVQAAKHNVAVTTHRVSAVMVNEGVDVLSYIAQAMDRQMVEYCGFLSPYRRWAAWPSYSWMPDVGMPPHHHDPHLWLLDGPKAGTFFEFWQTRSDHVRLPAFGGRVVEYAIHDTPVGQVGVFTGEHLGVSFAV